ncbi:MAG: M20/M25/M40 family metallo-hydrolase [Candidatus Hadarchaeota archaeon]
MTEFEPRQAFEHVDRLAYDIGPRLAGSRGEELAAEYIEKQLKSYGLDATSQEFTFVDRALKRRASAVLLTSVLFASFVLPPPFPIAAWAIVLVVWRSLEKILPKKRSRNIIATAGAKSAEKEVAVSAHYDSARCSQNPRMFLFSRLFFLPSLAIATLSALLLSIGFSPWPSLALAAAFLASSTVFFISAGNRIISPGADDNASGAAVFLEIARVLAVDPPTDRKVTLVAFGAEEQGLVGSRMFAAKLLNPKAVFLNVDTVGVGPQPYIIEGNSLMLKVKTTAKMNQALADSIKRAGLEPKLWWAALAGHDHMPLVRRRYSATTLTFDATGSDKLGQRLSKIFKLPNARTRRYGKLHTMDDTPEHLELKTIELSGKIVLDFVRTVFAEAANVAPQDQTKSSAVS